MKIVQVTGKVLKLSDTIGTEHATYIKYKFYINEILYQEEFYPLENHDGRSIVLISNNYRIVITLVFENGVSLPTELYTNGFKTFLLPTSPIRPSPTDGYYTFACSPNISSKGRKWSEINNSMPERRFKFIVSLECDLTVAAILESDPFAIKTAHREKNDQGPDSNLILVFAQPIYDSSEDTIHEEEHFNGNSIVPIQTEQPNAGFMNLPYNEIRYEQEDTTDRQIADQVAISYASERIAAVAATFQLNNVVTLAQFDEKCSDIIDYIQQVRVNAIYHPNTQ